MEENIFVRNSQRSRTNIVNQNFINLDKLKKRDLNTNEVEDLNTYLNSDNSLNLKEKEVQVDDEFGLNNLIDYLNIPPHERTDNQIFSISKLVEKSKFCTNFQKKLTLDFSNENSILYLLGKYLKYEFVPKNKILFNQEDKGEKFYFIFKGLVKVKNIIQIEKSLTFFEFIEQLELLQSDQKLFNLSVKNNLHIYFSEKVKSIDFSFIKKLLKVKKSIEDIKTLNIIELNYLIDQININELTIKNDLNLSPHETLIQLKTYYLDQINKSLDKLGLIDYDKSEPKTVQIFEYLDIYLMGKGNYFGDTTLERNDNIRSETIESIQDLHLGTININEYKNFIMKIKKESEFSISNYLLQTVFNGLIKSKTFHFKYFSYFTYNEAFRGDLISKEDEFKYIFIIIEGEVDYFYNNSIQELKSLIRNLNNYIAEKKIVKFDEEIEIKDRIQSKMTDEINQFKLYSSGQDHIGGLDEFFGLKKYFQVKVKSKILKYFAISFQAFKRILEKYPSSMKALKSFNNMKIKGLINILKNTLSAKLNSMKQPVNKKEIDLLPSKPSFIQGKRGSLTTMNLPLVGISQVKDSQRESVSPPISDVKNRLFVKESYFNSSSLNNSAEKKSSEFHKDSSKSLITLKDISKKVKPVKIMSIRKDENLKNINLYDFRKAKNNVGINIVFQKSAEKNECKSEKKSFHSSKELTRVSMFEFSDKFLSKKDDTFVISSKNENYFNVERKERRTSTLKIHDKSQLKKIMENSNYNNFKLKFDN